MYLNLCQYFLMLCQLICHSLQRKYYIFKFNGMCYFSYFSPTQVRQVKRALVVMYIVPTPFLQFLPTSLILSKSIMFYRSIHGIHKYLQIFRNYRFTCSQTTLTICYLLPRKCWPSAQFDQWGPYAATEQSRIFF